MCNLSRNIIDSALEKGIAEGMERGIEEGIEKGIKKERLNAIGRMSKAEETKEKRLYGRRVSKIGQRIGTYTK